MDQPPLYITVLFLRRGRYWVAQGLELDLTAQGTSLERAKHAFEQTLLRQVQLDIAANRDPLSRLSQAPQKYWDVFRALLAAKRKPLKTPEPLVSAEVPESCRMPAFMIQAVADTGHRTSR